MSTFESGTFGDSDAGEITRISSWSNGLAYIAPSSAHRGLYGVRCEAICTEQWFGPVPGEPNWGGARARIWWESMLQPRPPNMELFVRVYAKFLRNDVKNGIEFLRFHTVDTGGLSSYITRLSIQPTQLKVSLGGTNGPYDQWFPVGHNDVVNFFRSLPTMNEWHCIEERVVLGSKGGVDLWVDEVKVLDTVGQYNCTPCPGTISSIQMGVVTSSPTNAVIGTAVIYDLDDVEFSRNYIGPTDGIDGHQLSVSSNPSNIPFIIRRVA